MGRAIYGVLCYRLQGVIARADAMRAAMICVALLLVPAGHSAAGSDEEAIRELLMSSFDRPDARLAVDPVVFANDHAIAGWIQDDRGGRALLKRKAGQWIIVLCSGDGIRFADAMRQAGVPTSDAAVLAARLEDAEKSMSSELRALLASFEGTVLMGAESNHPASARAAGGGQNGHPSHGQSGEKK